MGDTLGDDADEVMIFPGQFTRPWSMLILDSVITAFGAMAKFGRLYVRRTGQLYLSDGQTDNFRFRISPCLK